MAYLFQFHIGSIQSLNKFPDETLEAGFNSTLVRFKVAPLLLCSPFVCWFQFHIGSIQSTYMRALQGYGQQLREKQKVKRIYFILEGQFRNYFEKAARQKGITGENLLTFLERRLDNAVYRAGFATSRRQARQLLNHGHIEVNGRKVDIPSFQVKAGDQVGVREGAARTRILRARGRRPPGGAAPPGSPRAKARWPRASRHSRRAATSTAQLTNNSSSSFTASNLGAPRARPLGRRTPRAAGARRRALLAPALSIVTGAFHKSHGHRSAQPLDRISDAAPPRRRGRTSPSATGGSPPSPSSAASAPPSATPCAARCSLD